MGSRALVLLGLALLLLLQAGALSPPPPQPQPPRLQLTGRRVALPDWPYTVTPQPIRQDKEERVARVLVRKGEFVGGRQLSDQRVCQVLDEIGDAGKAYMTLQQAMSLRKQLLVNKLVGTSWRLRESLPQVVKSYERGGCVLDLAIKLDLPPVALLRAVFTARAEQRFPDLWGSEIKETVKRAIRLGGEPDVEEGDGEDEEEAEEESQEAVVTTAVAVTGDGGGAEPTRRRPRVRKAVVRQAVAALLGSRDVQQLALAKAADQVSFSEDNIEERDVSQAWERRLYEHLDAHGVRYVTEESLIAQGFRSTPDAVLLDDVFINGQLVRWVDSKAYFGTWRSKIFSTKTKKQVERYNKEFDGAGALVYRLGFSRELQLKLRECGCLLLDRGLLPDVVVENDDDDDDDDAKE